MKNTLKPFGFIAFVAVISFSMIACGDDGQGDLLNGTWDRGDIVITFSGSNGVFTEIKTNSTTWLPVLNSGSINIGDRKFRNISYDGNLRWTGQELTYATTTAFAGGNWERATLTISGNILTVETENATGPGTYTRQ